MALLQLLSLAPRIPYLVGKRLASTARVLRLRVMFRGFKAYGPVEIGPGCDIYVQRGGTLVLRGTHVSRGVTLTAGRTGRLEINRVYVGSYSTIAAREEIVIGDGCKIAERVTIRDANHDHSERLSAGAFVSAPIRIEEDVWLGANAVVLAGVTIGEGATVGASAVVTRDVDSGATVVGVPARPVQTSHQDKR